MQTGDLFAVQDVMRAADEKAQRFAKAEASHRESWRLCWGWGGPIAGELCEVNRCVVQREAGGTVYAYMEQCRLIEQRPNGQWLAVIEMGEVWGKPWWKDGARLLLGVLDIWPPTKWIRQQRDEAKRIAA